MASNDLPVCPNHHRGSCPRSQVVLLRETSGTGNDFWSFGCETCLLVFVRTKPTSQSTGRSAAMDDQRRTMQRNLQRWESRTKFFVQGKKV